MEAAPGHRKSCQPCRRRHLRCDRSTPTCSNCRKSKYPPQCDYDAADQLKFRTHVFGPPKSARNGQPDSHSSSNSERRKRSKPSVTSRVRQEQQSSSPVPGPNLVPGPEDAPVVPTPAAEPVSGSPLSSLSSDPGPPGGSPIEQPSMGSFAIFSPPRAPEQCFETDERPPQPSRVSNIDTLLSGLSQLSPPSQLPFTDSTEAMIFKYYLESAGPWLDVTSPNRYFGVHIPRMAITQPVLLSACLAYASHVLHLHGIVSAHLEEHLHDRALRLLTPLVTLYREASPSARENDVLGAILGTTILLRMKEQFLEPGEDRQHHFRASSTLFETLYDNASPSDDSLSSASLWAYLRGTIRVSVLLGQPCPFALEHLKSSGLSSSCGTLTDEARANIMTYLMAEVCTVSWQSRQRDRRTMQSTSPSTPSYSMSPSAFSPDRIESEIARIERALDEWESNLPASFQPWYVHRSEHDVFPEVFYLADWHCVAWQFFYTARIMLAVLSGPMLRDKTDVLSMARFLEDKIASPARWLCGMTLSTNSIGVKINGSHLLAWSAQYLTGTMERAKVLETLSALSDQVKWPSIACITRLENIWNGSQTNWIAHDQVNLGSL